MINIIMVMIFILLIYHTKKIELFNLFYFIFKIISKNLKKLYIKEGVTSLNYGSLYFCENLEEIHLPKSLKKIDKYALEYNDKLKLIKYASNKSGWYSIKIEENNTILKSNIVKIEYIINNIKNIRKITNNNLSMRFVI